MPYTISQDTATEAYTQAARAAAEARKMALIYDRLAKALDKTFVNCKIADKAAQIFPAYNVRYYKYDSGCKALHFSPKAEEEKPFTLDIARKEERYLTAESLQKRAEYYRQQAEKYQKALEDFWECLGQYNVLVNELNKTRNKIATVMYCSRYHHDF